MWLAVREEVQIMREAAMSIGMNAAEVMSRLKALEPELRQAGLEALYLFGSMARGDARGDSDVDLAFDAGKWGVNLWERAEIMAVLVERLGVDVDLVDRHALRARIRDSAAADMVRVF